ncbi:LodA/GoxA family CTQ-dependent oxidase [Thetidibacter halocola]|uniref:LodA/GoxA family CTQ-dependent oxidase n=1 Tax=Thetidibacter halocola TaxID=2827239 RepID=A0A8J7WJP1_9RHOB|nr:LodA/GoxA family CTQ-dependent oxidase [Thetidibacter halocola]MBS0126876.1 LodA/GoxA family CTQ-dependent oxidase [Thetidibacter halocola]
MSDKIFRVHPSIGFARFGTSPDYYLAPETAAGMSGPEGQDVDGGLPIKAGTEDQTITSSDLRDNTGALVRQAARFRIFAYDCGDQETYPQGAGTEIRIGTKVGGRTVTDITWCVHLANKKANGYFMETGIAADRSILSYYNYGGTPGLRNAQEGPDPTNPARLKKLIIDAGPRAVSGAKAARVAFDRDTPCAYIDDSGQITEAPDYPKCFPSDVFANLYEPDGPIDTLGEIETDAHGRLIVLPGRGRAVAWTQPDGSYFPLTSFVDNDGWFDDASDGPVEAMIHFDDGTTATVHGGWVTATDPGYAPQTLNVVSLWDDVYDAWVRDLRLQPEIYTGGYNRDFEPDFDEHISPTFKAAALQRWNTNMPSFAIDAHDATGEITADDAPGTTIMAGLAFIRNPNLGQAESSNGAPLMPLSLGDSGKSFLSTSLTQYFFLEQWNAGKYTKANPKPLGQGERLDKVSLMNCLGGRFSPGIDMTFIARQSNLYQADWRGGPGPFRIAGRPLDYATATPNKPFLGEGYVPLHTGEGSVEPGDICKFMALPWHTDYNSCATHTTAPYTNSTLYWSWPAQRPVAVYAAMDVKDGQLGEQRYSVRGKGTENDNPALQGRYQDSVDMILNWSRIGIVIQGTAIDGGDYSRKHYLEVQSQLDAPEVEPWPINDTSRT